MRDSRFVFWLGVFCLSSAAAFALNVFLGTRGFDGYDMSPMIDAGWRVFSGQVPGKDFLVTFPPSLYLLTAFFFRIFGVTWHALTLGASCFYAVVLVLGLRVSCLLRRTEGAEVAIWTAGAYTVAQVIFLLPGSNTVWHSEIAMAAAMYAVYATLVLLGAKDRHPWISWEAMVHLSLACAVLLLSKANTAYPALLLCFFVLERGHILRRRMAGLFIASALLACLALASVRVSFFGMLAAYAGLTGRILPKALLYGILYNTNVRFGLANLLIYAIIGPTLCTALAYGWRRRAALRTQPVDLLAIGSILISLLGMGTNNQFKLSDVPLALLGLTILATRSELASPAMRRSVLITACALYFTTFYFARTRLAFQITGGWVVEGCAVSTIDDLFLGHMKVCDIGPQVLGEVNQALASASPNTRVFFGPGLEFLYAARRLPSPSGMPNWWDPGTSYPLARADEIGRSWENRHFDLLIFAAAEDQGQMPPFIQASILRNYIRVGSTQAVHLYRLRKATNVEAM